MKTYLGDSVYAEWNGFQIVLTTENGDGEPSNRIYLDDPVIDALNGYCRRIRDIGLPQESGTT